MWWAWREEARRDELKNPKRERGIINALPRWRFGLVWHRGTAWEGHPQQGKNELSINGHHAVQHNGGEIHLSFVVPCHNEQEGLAELHRRIDAAAREVGKPFEVVLVNDGSTDGTWGAVRRLAAEHGEVVAVSLSRSFGQQAALAAGLSLARGERVLTLDADLQDPPELIVPMLAKMEQGADVVHARRRSRHGESFFKRSSAAAFYRLLNWLTETRVERDSGEFRLLNRRAVEVLARLPERRRLLRGLAAWIGFEQAVVEYDRPPRAFGKSKFPLGEMLALATDAVTAFSIRPLRLASALAVVCGAAATAGAACGLGGLIAGRAWTAWALAAALLCTLAGMQLLVLGVIGEYLGRLYEQSLERPLFIIDEVVRIPASVCERRPGLKCPKESEANAPAVFRD